MTKKNVTSKIIQFIGKLIKSLSAKGGILFALIIAIIFIGYSFTGFNTNKSNNSNIETTTPKSKSIDLSDNLFKFKDLNNLPYDLNGLKGQKNIVFYFFKTTCIECKNEISSILSSFTGKSDYLLLLVSNESLEAIKNYSSQLNNESIAYYNDSTSSFANYFSVDDKLFTPSVFIFDKNQNLFYSYYGYSNTLTSMLSYLYNPLVLTPEYRFLIDENKIDNACKLSSNGSYSYKSNPNKIDVTNLQKNLTTDDLVNCVDTVYPKYSKVSDQSYFSYQTNSDTEVFYINVNGIVKIYPKYVLENHPYIEDLIGLEPVGIFYDGLTNSANVFSRNVGGKEYKFLLSGRIYNNHFLLIDTTEFNLWDGTKSVAGNLSGNVLQQIPIKKSLLSNFVKEQNAYLILPPLSFIDYKKDILSDYSKNTVIVYPLDNYKSLYPKKEYVIRIEDQIFAVKDLTLPYSGTTSSGLQFFITTDSYGGIAVFKRKIGNSIYDFDNKTGVLIDKSSTPSTWSKDMTATEGPLSGNSLEEIPFQSGYYFYLQ